MVKIILILLIIAPITIIVIGILKKKGLSEKNKEKRIKRLQDEGKIKRTKK